MKRTRWMHARRMAVAVLVGTQAGCALLGGGAPPETPQQAQERVTLEQTIRSEVEARMAAEPAIGAGRIRAVVNGGDVQLHGAAPGFGALQCALANAGLVPGVHLVVDMMVLEPGPRTVTCLAPRVFSGTASAP
ncbi:BON domain-containing protein [Longimicrobium sp.]|uniref:BON domain-containing protein n=1 Tax=Longimicrobium sp. TaxID=2029185 RepID=UPI002E3315B4|nr:BON domain-containing protein [Longimicrobium sp.]HEX6037802.1 BON domain-containing protein [Longimicrobium sp.]